MFLEKGIHELFVFLHVERESQSNTFLAIIGSNKHEGPWLGCVWFGLFFGRRLFVGFWLVDLDVASVCSHKSSIFLPERGDGDGLCGREWWDTKEVELNSFFVGSGGNSRRFLFCWQREGGHGRFFFLSDKRDDVGHGWKGRCAAVWQEIKIVRPTGWKMKKWSDLEWETTQKEESKT